MGKYKVGNRVRVVATGSFPRHCFNVGDELEIMKLHEYRYGVVRCRRFSDGCEQWVNKSDFAPQFSKIVITTDGTITTARLFFGKELVKSAEAKCSKSDTFDFEKGAALAVARLLGREEKKPEPEPGFRLSDMVPGRFGRTSLGKWFVVLSDTVVYEKGGYDFYPNSAGAWEGSGEVDCLVEARSFRHARTVAANPLMHRAGPHKIIWMRPGANFE